jgi:translocation and assembly module TamB
MAAGVDEQERAPARHRSWPHRAQRIAIGIALVLLVALIGLWLARKPIASGVIDRTLAAKGVPASYGIADLGFGEQRLTNVVIGDPSDPDLVADWIETETSIGLSGAAVTGIRAGHVRLRGRLIDGRVSFGTIDRLLPPPSGKPFSLPQLDVDVDDARIRLETPIGTLGLKVTGAGRLNDGFTGRVAAVANSLTPGGCSVERFRAAVAIRITQGSPHVMGPIRAGAIGCGETQARAPAATVDATLSPALDRWRGRAEVAGDALRNPGATARAMHGTIDFAGAAEGTSGNLNLAVRDVRGAPGRAQRVTLDGAYRMARASGFEGRFGVEHAALAPAMLARLDGLAGGEGTPLAPLAEKLRGALRMGARDLSVQGALAVHLPGQGGTVRVSELSLRAASGAAVTLTGASGIAYDWPNGGIRLDTDVAMSGGGLPEARIALRQARAGAPVTGQAILAPYAVAGARLALTPVHFSAAPGGATRITTRATLSGPLGNGSVTDLSVPIDARWNGRGTLSVDPACAPVSFRRLAVSGLTLDPARLNLCPTGPALISVADGTIDGGARIGAARLTGRLGTSPVTLAASGATVALGQRGFTLANVATRIGSPDRVTRLNFASIAGRLSAGAVTGSFSGGAGQIANVPLLLGAAAGDWSLRGGALRLTGTLGVSDAQTATPRFKPMVAHDVALGLVDDRITATGTLNEPTRHVKVADVTIHHDLAKGSGDADLAVPGITFTKDFQPELLTPVTFGVIADVRGTVTGSGHVGWSQAGVTSTGAFSTESTDLAAAFGPVTGIKGTIHFTDLLSLKSAPGQIATVASINPGIPVTDGRFVYQTYPNSRVQVTSGVWPFAGGTLTLEPTLLDFGKQGARRLTFRIEAMNADKFLQQFDFKNLDATGVFDGVLPMVFDDKGGNIVNGHLTVREGGGTIRYVGDISQKDLGFWGNLAFGALKSLKYRSLDIVMNGPLAGEMVTEVRFAGISQGEGAKTNFIIRRLQRLPFVFNIRIKAPFRGLLDSAQSFYDPSRLIERNLPQLLEEQRRQTGAPSSPPVQTPDSRIVP